MQRQGREFWTKVVDEYEATSGETHAEFAARRRVGKATFERWLYLLRGERSKPSAGSRVRLLPVQVAVGHCEQHVLVEVSGGVGLRVTVGTVTVRAKTWLPQAPPAQRHYPPEATAAGVSGGFQFWGRSSSS